MFEQVNFPAQCSCGHIILEKYVFSEDIVKETGIAGFSWCGFCRTRRNVKSKLIATNTGDDNE